MDTMEEIQRTLGKICANQERTLAVLEKHDERITRVEKTVNYAVGAVILVGSLATVFWNVIVFKIRGLI